MARFGNWSSLSSAWNLCEIKLFKGSLISKMSLEDTFHFQGSYMSFKSWNP